MKYTKSLILALSCLVVMGIAFFAWPNEPNEVVFAESKDGKWRVEYVKEEEWKDPINQYYCILTYQGQNIQNIESLSFKYYYGELKSPASYGNYTTKDEIEFPMTFGLYGPELKNGEKRIVKLEWKESGKTYKTDLTLE